MNAPSTLAPNTAPNTRPLRRALVHWLGANAFVPRWLPARWQHPAMAYLLGMLVQVPAVLIIWFVHQTFPGFPLLSSLALLAVVLVALSSGTGPSLLATVVGTLLLDLFVIAPSFEVIPAVPADQVGVFVFLLAGLGISYSASQTARAQRVAEASAHEARQANERLQALQTLTDTALTYLRLEDLLPELLPRIREIMRLDNISILLLGDDQQTLTVRATIGLEEEIPAQIGVPIGQGFAGQIAASRKPLVVEDIKHFDTVNPFLREKLHSVMGVPLLVEDRLIGVLHTGTAQPRHFTAEDVQLLQRVADRISLAIERAQIYEAEQRARANWRESAERFRAIIEQAAVGIARVGLDGRWLQVNQRLCDMLGYTHDELLARTSQDITHPADREADLALGARLLTGEIPTYTLEKRYIRKDGSPVWINRATALVRDAAGEPDYLISIAEDISTRKAAEAQVQQLMATLEQRVVERTKQLEEANSELDGFASSVAHDLRAPLRAMQGFSQALIEDYAGDLDPTAQDYIRRIGAAAAGMDTLIQDLLTYSRISRSELKLQSVSLQAVVDEAQRGLESELRASDALVEVQAPLPLVSAQPLIMIQVVTNLLSNAIKFVAPGTRPNVRIWAEPRGERVRLWVEDNGIGIAPAHQERIFGVFERLHGRETYPGTGIGLAIVRKGVERMGGRAGVESAPGQGSRFWIELPTRTAKQPFL
jgi:PAS domain S-box-containing protein